VPSLLLPAEYIGDRAHFWEEHNDGFAVVSIQDVTPAIEDIRGQRLANDGYSDDRSVRRVAHVPQSIRDLWLQNEGWDAYRPDLYPDKLAAKFNDPDYAFLRTAEGRLGVTDGVLR